MAWKSRPSSALQRELLRLLRPHDRRLQEQPSERILPRLVQIATEYAGHPAAETLPLLEEAVRSVGARPDMTALREFAEDISRGENPFD
ncbi:MAG: hypothetical protein ACJ71Y_20010 [Blastococcus sp.]